MVWLPDGEKISQICLFVLTWSMHVTDIAWWHRPRLCIASRGKNDTCSSLLLYLLLSSCDGNDALWRHSVLVKQSTSCSRKRRILSVPICVHQIVRLTTEFVDWWGTCCVHCTNTCLRYQPLWPESWSRTSLTHSKHITERHRWISWSMEKADTCKHEAKRHHFEHLLN